MQNVRWNAWFNWKSDDVSSVIPRCPTPAENNICKCDNRIWIYSIWQINCFATLFSYANFRRRILRSPNDCRQQRQANLWLHLKWFRRSVRVILWQFSTAQHTQESLPNVLYLPLVIPSPKSSPSCAVYAVRLPQRQQSNSFALNIERRERKKKQRTPQQWQSLCGDVESKCGVQRTSSSRKQTNWKWHLQLFNYALHKTILFKFDNYFLYLNELLSAPPSVVASMHHLHSVMPNLARIHWGRTTRTLN